MPRLFFDVEIALFDVWDNRQFGVYKYYFGRLEQVIDQAIDMNPIQHARVHGLLRAISKASSFDEIYELLGFRYVIDPSGTLKRFQDESFAVIFSCNVLEHVDRGILPEFIQDFHRTLKPGGYSIHQIDPGDHLAYYDRNVSLKNYLRYSDRVWRRYFESDVQYFNRVQRSDSTGIDSMAITPDGKTIYMPDGELSPNGIWNIIDANTGNVIGRIDGGTGPHNTIVSLDGTHVYLGGRNYNYLEVADISTGTVVKKIGPLKGGVRPFTINGRETLAYTTATGFLGFQVSDITTGRVLYTVPIQGFSWNPATSASCPSHGISLSPDEKELYVMDSPNSYVHVFDVSGVPSSPPKQVADIRLTRSMTGYESPCAYDCRKDGWLQHSRDGRFVYVGDSGDVIDTATRKSVTDLFTLYNSRKMLEIDWQNGVPIFTTSRSGLGYVTNAWMASL